MAMRAIYPRLRCAKSRSIPVILSNPEKQATFQALNQYIPCASFSRWWPRPFYTDWPTPFRHDVEELPRFMLREVSRRNRFNEEWRNMMKDFFEIQPLDIEKSNGTITEKDGKFTYSLQMEGFKPENIKIKAVGQKIVIDAAKETNSEENGFKSYSKKHFQHAIVLPDNVKPDDVTSILTNKGVLRVSAPVMQLPEAEEKTIEVEKEPVEDVGDTKKST